MQNKESNVNLQEKSADIVGNANTHDKVSIKKSSIEYAGPLPPPKMLKQYDDVIPGSAGRIIEWVEKEQAHRHKLENKIVNTESRDSLLGIINAGVISLVLLIGGFVVILSLRTTSGTIIGGLIDISGIATIIGTYLKGTRTNWQVNGVDDQTKDDI